MTAFVRILFFIFVVKPLLSILIGFAVFGREHLPRDQQFILVANHNSHLDALALMNLFPLKRLSAIRPVAAGDYFMVNPLLRWFSTTFLNILPIPRSGFSKSNNPLTLMGTALAQGQSLILFPEGSRGEPEQMGEFKAGIAHLILKYPDVPVVPVFLRGMGRSLPRGELLLVPFFCDVVVGAPRYFSGDKAAVVEQVEGAVRELAENLDRWVKADE